MREREKERERPREEQEKRVALSTAAPPPVMKLKLYSDPTLGRPRSSAQINSATQRFSQLNGFSRCFIYSTPPTNHQSLEENIHSFVLNTPVLQPAVCSVVPCSKRPREKEEGWRGERIHAGKMHSFIKTCNFE